MPVKIKFDVGKVAARIEDASKKAIGELAGQIRDDCNIYCPEDSGELIRSSEIHSDIPNGKIVWQTPYARNMYYGIVMVDPKTKKACFVLPDGTMRSRADVRKIKSEREYRYTKKGACKLWCQKAKEEHGEAWRKMYKDKIGKELKK